MVKKYELDTEDEKILDELDNLCGVIQNKEVLKDIILYTKLKQDKKIDFGNYNIIIRSDTSYDILKDFLKVCAKIFMKYKIIKNDKICFFEKVVENRRNDDFTKISGIEEDIVVINERKLRFTFTNEIDDLKKMIEKNKDKVFIFEDTNYCEGELDAELGDLATWRMKINKISLDDKITYCKNKLEENGMKCKEQNLKKFADVPFWELRNILTRFIIECKSRDITVVDEKLLKENKQKIVTEKVERKRKKIDKKAKEELNELIGLEDVKKQVGKVVNYIKLNKERGELPTLHMCFTGNPGTGKTSIARIIGKLFKEENILSKNGEFVEIHGRDLVDQYVGWTAQKVHKTVKRAIGGVLFIDEAYSLVANTRGSFEDEAIATLIKEMEDHRSEICIILAGYTDEMEKLIKLNPGFESRIQFTINFPNYNEEELLEIFKGLCRKEKYKLSKMCEYILIYDFRKARKYESFGNGRYVRNLFEKIKFEQADRIIRTNSKAINSINKEDVEKVIKMIDNKEINKRKIGF